MKLSDKKQRQLIGIACGQLGIDKETKAEMLRERFDGKGSTTLLSFSQAEEFLEELKLKGFQARKPVGRYPKRPDIDRAKKDKQALLKKIEAHLAEANRPWSYVDGMAKHMFKVEKVQWCSAGRLHKIVAALEYDARRHGRKTG